MTARDSLGRFTASDDDVRRLARDLDRRFSHRPDAPPLRLARDVDAGSGVRSTLAKHFPHWDLTENPPVFAEALAACEGASA